MIKKILFISSLIAFSSVFSQKTHTVIKGDNSYNISKKYGISLDEFYRLNPKIKDGKLALGDILVVQKNGSSSSSAKSTPSTTTKSATGKIVLQPKQTIYGITKQYQISESDLRNLNPELDSHMKIGDEVTLPLDKITKFGGDQKAVAEKTVEKVEVETPAVSVVNTLVAEDSYEVQAKDNYYKITRKFDISKEDLFAMNSGLEAKGLQAGDIIKVKGKKENTVVETEKTPIATNTNDYSSASVSEDYVTYTVQSGDTVFGILNKFGITLDELISLNPNISEGLKSGMTLKINKLDAAYIKKSGDALNIVLMLPFGFDTNDSKYRTLALDFLSGAKLAIERNAKSGQKLDVKVVDAGNAEHFL